MLRLIIWPGMMLLGWTETKLWTLKYGSKPYLETASPKHLNPNFFFFGRDETEHIRIKNFIILSVSGIFKGFKNWQKVAEICYQLVHDRVSRGLDLTSQTHLHGINSLWTCMQNSLWRQIQKRPMPLTSSVMRQRISNFRLYCCSKKFQMLRKMLIRFWNSKDESSLSHSSNWVITIIDASAAVTLLEQRPVFRSLFK